MATASQERLQALITVAPILRSEFVHRRLCRLWTQSWISALAPTTEASPFAKRDLLLVARSTLGYEVKHLYLVATAFAVSASAFADTPAEERDFGEFAAAGCKNRNGDFIIRGLVSSANVKFSLEMCFQSAWEKLAGGARSRRCRAPSCWPTRRTRELQRLSLFPAVAAGVAKRLTKRSASSARVVHPSS
jgi:hypothetical protein